VPYLSASAVVIHYEEVLYQVQACAPFTTIGSAYCVFLPARRSKRGICYGDVAGWLAGWLAGCMSVTRRYCIKTAKPILKRLRPSGIAIILVYSDSWADTQFQGKPLQRSTVAPSDTT